MENHQESRSLMICIALALRGLVLGCLIASLVNLPSASATISIPDENGQLKETIVKFTHFLAYRYMQVCGVIGIIFTILLVDIWISHNSNYIRPPKFEWYNEIMSIVLTSGAAASFFLASELSRLPDEVLQRIASTTYLKSMYFLSNLYLIGFVFNLISSVLTRVATSCVAY